MKTNFRFIIAFLCSVLIMFILSSCNAKTKIPADEGTLTYIGMVQIDPLLRVWPGRSRSPLRNWDFSKFDRNF